MAAATLLAASLATLPTALPPLEGASVLATCAADATAQFTARLQGVVTEMLDWQGPLLACAGMPRPPGPGGQAGLRLAFAGPTQHGRLTVLLTLPTTPVGAPAGAPTSHSASAASPAVAAAHLGLLLEHGAGAWATRTGACSVEALQQVPLPAASFPVAGQRWRISGRGLCLEPARDPTGRHAPLLIATFDFAGELTVPAMESSR